MGRLLTDGRDALVVRPEDPDQIAEHRFDVRCAANAETARQCLSSLPDSDFKRALLWVPDFVVARDK